MIQKERPKIAPFLAAAFAVAALMYGFNYAFQNRTEDVEAKARVSKNDIRRALSLPLEELVSLTENQTSFLNEFASLNANMIVIEFPLMVRIGTLVYLEWNQLDIIAMDKVIEQIHNAGMEAAVSGCLIDNQALMDDSELSLDAYNQYVDWLTSVSASSLDAMFIHPADFHAKVPASSIIKTFELLYETYPGRVLVFMDHNDMSSSLSHRKLAAGYIAETEHLELNVSMVEELEDPESVTFIVRLSTTEKPGTKLFEPYLHAQSITPQLIPVSEMRSSIEFISRKEMFRGVIVSAGNWDQLQESEHQKYRDEIRTWFAELKSLSRNRAFSQHSSPEMLE